MIHRQRLISEGNETFTQSLIHTIVHSDKGLKPEGSVPDFRPGQSKFSGRGRTSIAEISFSSLKHTCIFSKRRASWKVKQTILYLTL